MRTSKGRTITTQSTHYLGTDYVGLQETCPHCREPLFFLFQLNIQESPPEFQEFWKMNEGFIQTFFCPHCLHTHEFDTSNLSKNIRIRTLTHKHTREGFHFQPKTHDLAKTLAKMEPYVVIGWNGPIRNSSFEKNKMPGIWVPNSSHLHSNKSCKKCNQPLLPFLTIYNGQFSKKKDEKDKSHSVHIFKCPDHEQFDFIIDLF